MKNIIVYDIDGCILEPNPERIKALIDDDLDTYHALHHLDKVIQPGVIVYESLFQRFDLRHVFITGRMERGRHYTEARLLELFPSSDLGRIPLLMRPDDLSWNVCPDPVFKPLSLQRAGFKLEGGTIGV